MIKVIDVYEYMKTIAPEEIATESDNVGFLVGTGGAAVTKIIVSLDITDDVIAEALDTCTELIIAHHPLFFSLKSVTDADITGRKIVRMLSGGISAICMHTNLDAVGDGVNDMLAIAAGIADNNRKAEPLSGAVRLDTGEIISFGRIGYLKEACPMPVYLKKLGQELNTNGLRYHDAGINVHRIAVASGSGGSQWENARNSNCDTFITADIKYHMFLEAVEYGINLIDAGHFCTENVITGVLAEKLTIAFPEAEVNVSKALDRTIKFYTSPMDAF